ncbi:hypothetical protein [Bacillus sp. AFS041924]|uniref:hypothetical protein n=1 Tax=Bacillus sp. AFS041924 TaxID=2033503 RepID=UPI000BFB9DCF|nr:hypothetical protein [Bacillus sp. AFS041924]PGS53441.1 hypothetical protein COC46_07435 [Bacillus sp. AFS041924]
MARRLGLALLFTFFILTGCSINEALKGSKPPKTMIQIDKQTYETKLGTYCWIRNGHGECVDTAGPVELLEDEKPIVVNPGENVTIKMNYHQKPNEIHLTQINNDKEIEVVVVKNQFTAPIKKGVYYYSYGVWWKDSKDKHVSNGDASYVFVLEVK